MSLIVLLSRLVFPATVFSADGKFRRALATIVISANFSRQLVLFFLHVQAASSFFFSFRCCFGFARLPKWPSPSINNLLRLPLLRRCVLYFFPGFFFFKKEKKNHFFGGFFRGDNIITKTAAHNNNNNVGNFSLSGDVVDDDSLCRNFFRGCLYITFVDTTQ